jgi:hypothetical protein
LPEAGRYGVAVCNNGGFGDYSVLFDDSTPTTPTIITDKYSAGINSLSASWINSSDPETGIIKYEYAIGTTAGSNDVADWTDVGTDTSMTKQGLSLIYGQSYYVSIRATNGIGMVGIKGVSNPIIIVRQVSDIAAAKELPDGSLIKIDAKPISAIFNGRFYISEVDRFSGIGVNWSETVTEGATVNIVGTLATRNGERFIDATDVKP